MDRKRAALTPSRAALLDRLRLRRGRAVTLVELAAETGQHVNTLREHLEALVAAGLVARERAATGGRGRPPALYSAVPGQPEQAVVVRDHQMLVRVLATQIARSSADPRADSVAAGEEWGAVAAAAHPGRASGAEAVLALLDEAGFAPVAEPGTGRVRLHRCPFIDVARTHPEVVCGVHLGAIRGALAARGADPATATLHPFAEPGACLVELGAPV